MKSIALIDPYDSRTSKKMVTYISENTKDSLEVYDFQSTRIVDQLIEAKANADYIGLVFDYDEGQCPEFNRVVLNIYKMGIRPLLIQVNVEDAKDLDEADDFVADLITTENRDAKAYEYTFSTIYFLSRDGNLGFSESQGLRNKGINPLFSALRTLYMSQW